MNHEQKELFAQLVNNELTRAERKHPKFADSMTEQNVWHFTEMKGGFQRLLSERPQCADEIAQEEFAETMEAYTAGHKVDAAVELAQSACVHFRIFEMMWAKMTESERKELTENLNRKPTKDEL